MLLSTWDRGSFDLPEAFGFQARIALMEDFSNSMGIQGKFETVKLLQPTAWADDHITGKMKSYANAQGIVTAVPKKGYITEAELIKFSAAIASAPPREPLEVDTLLHTIKPKGNSR